MNRILLAEVILTLTREQAEGLLDFIEEARSKFCWSDEQVRAIRAVREQCAEQGVKL